MDPKEKDPNQDAVNAEMKAKLEVLEQVAIEKDEEIAALKKQVTALESAQPAKRIKGDAPVVKLGKSQYQVVGGAFYKGKKYSREELAKDKEVLKDLILNGSTLVVEI